METGAHPLLDRELERGRIDRVLELARQGRSAALVLQGEPGTGKSTLLDYAIESGRDFEVVRLLGIESETELGFAALHQLLLPFLAGLRSLPAPQRDALGGALGLRRADSPDRFLLAWPRLPCWPVRPRSGRCCASSMTHSGLTGNRPASWVSSRGGSALMR
jgi:hypothetical protein